MSDQIQPNYLLPLSFCLSVSRKSVKIDRTFAPSASILC
ncbi:unknown [[Mannheimia] succiniciproducens MBEL55E]|uniref:Uncharacterized protein n=1 Tax=Mannheimia succiniciproducens (strain KCTC 0769BP / MBEL55E) TaxID=221988 RepID=Q65VP9_MANSM|nr:unknown [[Mannheimia] succiniciproducens MBEL55E]